MGDPKKTKKKYNTPQHPWSANRIKEENSLKNEYGLKNKKEVWKSLTLLRKLKQQSKKLIAAESEQAKKEEKQLIEKLYKLNLVNKNAKVDDILDLDLKALLDRRLQTQFFKRGFAKSIKQARQFITHKHVVIGDKIVNKPSYMVKKDEESKINFNPISGLSKSDHPERVIEKKEKSKEVKVLRKKVEKVEKPKDVKKEKNDKRTAKT